MCLARPSMMSTSEKYDSDASSSYESAFFSCSFIYLDSLVPSRPGLLLCQNYISHPARRSVTTLTLNVPEC